MKIEFAKTIRHYDKKNLGKDLCAGLIIMAVSIPISMGYAQIAGLPAVYGLFGSVFPIILFALFTTSPQFIFGVDAAPAALVGGALITLGVESGSDQAMAVVPVITFFVAVWLLAFHFLKAGKLVNYISMPVMGGFITGICSTIILMQVPKLMGGSAGIGELPELIEHLLESVPDFNLPSLLIGVISLVILLVMKKIVPKFPMAIVLMIGGAVLSAVTPIKEMGVATLSAVEPGLPVWSIPDFSSISIRDIIMLSLSISVVIMAETLLAENNFAQKNGYRLNDNQELLAFALGSFAAAFTGCCPVNGSVSRTAMAEQYQSKTQVTSLVAGGAMIVLLLVGTGFIGYLPVPVLTAIVISALIGATEFHLAAKLWTVSKKEFLIFVGAFLGVLIFGTINGVLIGIILSFADMIIRSAKPFRGFMGVKPGHDHLRQMEDSNDVFSIKGVVVYRFSSSIFFANASVLRQDIENCIKEDTKAVILDASAIGSIDMTAAETIDALYKRLKKQGIRFYMTEHISNLNEQLRQLGLGYLIDEGAVRRTTHIALKDMGIHRPYPLEGDISNAELSPSRKRVNNTIQEFTWAYGSHAEEAIEKQITQQIQVMKETGDVKQILHGKWSFIEAKDEEEWIEHVLLHKKEISAILGSDESSVRSMLEKKKEEIRAHLEKEHPEIVKKFQDANDRRDET